MVRQEIFRSVFLNRFVMNNASFPMYVNGAHLCVMGLVSLCSVVAGCLRLGEGGLYVWMGKPLLDRMSRIMSSSFLYSSSFKLYVCSLLYRNLAAAYLCWAGWFEEYGMIVSVKVGFLCMEITQFVGVLWIVVSKKFILLSDSISAVNFMFWWMLLKSFCMSLMLVWWES